MNRRLSTSTLCLTLLLAACGGGGDSPAPPERARQAAAVSMTPALAPYATVLQYIYIGYFGRPADPEGLVWWANRLREIDGPLRVDDMLAAYHNNPRFKALIDSFADSAEYKSMYSGDNASFIDAVYANMFGREPDAEGRAFWIQALDSKSITRANAMLSIQAAARDNDKLLLTHKEQMATSFTKALDHPDRIKIYEGSAALYIGRAMLTGAFPLGNMQIFQKYVDRAVEDLELAYRMGQAPLVDVASGDKRIALVASSSQIAANGARLKQLAALIASDLSTRDPGYGPRWYVDVLTAASTPQQIQRQVRGYSGTLLIGDVPLPSNSIDPYRIPNCPLYRFDATGNTLLDSPRHGEPHPLCRNGQSVSLLHGRTPQTEIAEVARKLDQMIAYHTSSASANSRWAPVYRFINALWGGGGVPWARLDLSWSNATLYQPGQFSYSSSGTGAERMQSLLACLDSNTEMCVFNGHGTPQLIQAEGPGNPGEFYSKDVVNLHVSDVRARPIKAKFVSLVSCSTQDPGVPDNLGANLLMAGDALLTHGMDSVAAISNGYEREMIIQSYTALAAGATFAEAIGAHELFSPSVMQGDPFITQRSVPAGEWPKLAIDGKRYHGGMALVPVSFPDTQTGTTVYKTVVLTNKGKVALRVHAASATASIGQVVSSADGVQSKRGGVTMNLLSPSRYRPGGVGDNWLFDTLVLQPGESMPLRFELIPWEYEPQFGSFTGTHKLITNDPAAPHIVLELRGNVTAKP